MDQFQLPPNITREATATEALNGLWSPPAGRGFFPPGLGLEAHILFMKIGGPGRPRHKQDVNICGRWGRGGIGAGAALSGDLGAPRSGDPPTSSSSVGRAWGACAGCTPAWRPGLGLQYPPSQTGCGLTFWCPPPPPAQAIPLINSVPSSRLSELGTRTGFLALAGVPSTRSSPSPSLPAPGHPLSQLWELWPSPRLYLCFTRCCSCGELTSLSFDLSWRPPPHVCVDYTLFWNLGPAVPLGLSQENNSRSLLRAWPGHPVLQETVPDVCPQRLGSEPVWSSHGMCPGEQKSVSEMRTGP